MFASRWNGHGPMQALSPSFLKKKAWGRVRLQLMDCCIGREVYKGNYRMVYFELPIVMY